MKVKIEGWSRRDIPDTVKVNGEVFKRVPPSQEGVRAAYMSRTAVLKCDVGWAQCRKEALKLSGIKPKDSRHFPRLIASGRGWILVRRLPLAKAPITGEHARVINRLADRYKVDDVVTGHTPHNCAISRGVPVIYDLGV